LKIIKPVPFIARYICIHIHFISFLGRIEGYKYSEIFIYHSVNSEVSVNLLCGNLGS